MICKKCVKSNGWISRTRIRLIWIRFLDGWHHIDSMFGAHICLLRWFFRLIIWFGWIETTVKWWHMAIRWWWRLLSILRWLSSELLMIWIVWHWWCSWLTSIWTHTWWWILTTLTIVREWRYVSVAIVRRVLIGRRCIVLIRLLTVEAISGGRWWRIAHWWNWWWIVVAASSIIATNAWNWIRIVLRLCAVSAIIWQYIWLARLWWIAWWWNRHSCTAYWMMLENKITVNWNRVRCIVCQI